MKLLAYQDRWLNDEAQIKIIEKSRRIGLSWVSALSAVEMAAPENGAGVVYISYNKDSAKAYIEDCAYWARELNEVAFEHGETLIEDEGSSILAYTIKFRSGHQIQALSGRPSNLRGKNPGLVVIDEAAFHDRLDLTMKAATPITMWGGKIQIISTHNGVDSYFNQLINDSRAGRLDYSVHRVTFMDAIADGFYKRVCERKNHAWCQEREDEYVAKIYRNTGDDAAEELNVVPMNVGTTFISRVLVQQQMTLDGVVVRWKLPDEFSSNAWTAELRSAHIQEFCIEQIYPNLDCFPPELWKVAGVDFGRVSDRTCIAAGYLAQNLTRRFPLVIELLNAPFDTQERIIFEVLDALKPKLHGVAVDATGIGRASSERIRDRYGALVTAVQLSDKWYLDNMQAFKAAFEDGTIELVADADHLVDLSAFKIINGVPKLPKTKTTSSDGGKRHGDAAVAFALAYSASLQEVGEYAYEAGSNIRGTVFRGVGGVYGASSSNGGGASWVRAADHYRERDHDARLAGSRRGGRGVL